ARRLEQVEVAGPREKQVEAARRDGGEQLLRRPCTGDRLPELRQMLELPDSSARLLVEPRIFDCAGDERRARDEKLDLVLRELPGSLRMQGDDADRGAVLPDDRHTDQRLELLLFELR